MLSVCMSLFFENQANFKVVLLIQGERMMSKNLELQETLDLRWTRHMLDFPEEGAAEIACLQVLGKLTAE